MPLPYTTGVNVAEKQEDILSQFAEFLEAKKQADAEKDASEDFEVEIWDEKGRGVRTRRSHAKPFLQSLGIDVDSDDGGTDDDKDGDDKSGNTSKTSRKTTGKQSTNATSSGVARKYFTKPGA